MPNVLCGGTVQPSSVECDQGPASISVTVRVDNPEPPLYSVDYTVFFGNFSLLTETVVVAGNNSVSNTHTFDFDAPINDQVLECGTDVPVTVEKVDETNLGTIGFAPTTDATERVDVTSITPQRATPAPTAAQCGSVSISSPELDADDFTVLDCGPTRASVGEGESVRFEASVRNSGPVGADVRVQWMVNGTPVVGTVRAISPSGTASYRSGPITFSELTQDVGAGEDLSVDSEVVEVFPEGSFTETPTPIGRRVPDRESVAIAALGVGSGLAAALLR